MDSYKLKSALLTLGRTLRDRGLTYHIVVVGGSAILLAEGGSRPTQDVDVIAFAKPDDPPHVQLNLPGDLEEAVLDVASALDLDPSWLNTGPVGVIGHQMPEGWQRRMRNRTYDSLIVSVPARADLAKLKLLAAADEGAGGSHVHDLVRMSLTSEEVGEAAEWVNSRFPTGWCPGLEEVLVVLRRAR